MRPRGSRMRPAGRSASSASFRSGQLSTLAGLRVFDDPDGPGFVGAPELPSPRLAEAASGRRACFRSAS
ncbi:MAG TPA: hypothetical protein PK413_18210, partial [Thermoanaerobaculia bacterium]|nr:hypothetical protein [Thermoanaerobaculia bacterium]